MNDELRSLGSVRARGILLLIVVALAAGVAGGAIDRVWAARRGGEVRGGWERTSAVTTAPAASPESERTVRTDRSLAERQPPGERGGIPVSLRSIDLDPAQRKRIEQIAARYQPAAESLVMTIRGRVAELDLRMRQEAMCVLTPKQRVDWIAWRRRERVIVEDGDLMMKLVTTSACPR
jgi:hypothetical protein